MFLFAAGVATGLGLSAFWLFPAITPSELPDVPNLATLPERLPSYSTSATSLFSPKFQWDDINAMNSYLGLGAVGASIIALSLWRRRQIAIALALSAAVGIVLSMGGNTPLYDYVESLRRWFPERFIQPVALMLSILAAAGVQSAWRFRRIPRSRRMAIALVLLALILVDSMPFLRHTSGNLDRDIEVNDAELAS
jgi:hypothetical protein